MGRRPARSCSTPAQPSSVPVPQWQDRQPHHVSLLAVGNHTIKASYGGDTNFKTRAGTLTQTVNQDSSTTSVVSSANPSVYGQSMTFTATVAAYAGEWDADRFGHLHERHNDTGHSRAEWRDGFIQHRKTSHQPGHDHGDLQW